MQLLPAWSHMETKMLINNVWQYKYNIKHFSFFTHRNHNIFCITHIGLNLANFNVFCTTLLHFSVLALKQENNMLLAKNQANDSYFYMPTLWVIQNDIRYMKNKYLNCVKLFKQWNVILYISWKFYEFD